MGSFEWGYNLGNYGYNPYFRGLYNPAYSYHEPPSTSAPYTPKLTSQTATASS